jgi:DNA recombination protein RmuC
MNITYLIIGIVIGFAAGIITAYVLKISREKSAREIAETMLAETESKRSELIEMMKAQFGNLSLEALAKSGEMFLQLAKERLEAERSVSAQTFNEKKSLIDQQLIRITQELEKVGTVMQTLEKDRENKFGELSNQLKNASEKTAELTKTTGMLNEALASSKVRGQWGERMAEDVLRMAGFEENINYIKQTAIEGGSRPDFTFKLPKGLSVNMDVKFPLDNYQKYLNTNSESEKSDYLKKFLSDVKQRMKEITKREYINPEQNTVDYVLLFIPNEQIYSFINEHDHSLFDEGIKNKVVFCSPITLFVILAIIRQSIDTFTLAQTSNEILHLLDVIKKQWNMFVEKMDSLGKRIDAARREYDDLVTTRQRMLDRPFNKIESLKTERGLETPPDTNALPGTLNDYRISTDETD